MVDSQILLTPVASVYGSTLAFFSPFLIAAAGIVFPATYLFVVFVPYYRGYLLVKDFKIASDIKLVFHIKKYFECHI